jgi:hypothetical protein
MTEKPQDVNDFARMYGPDAVRAGFDHGTSSAGGKDGAATSNAGDAWPKLERSLISEDRPPAPPFDWDAVPPVSVEWIKGTASDCGAPVDYVFAVLVAVASAVIGNVLRVSPGIGWVEQLHLWFALVGPPSSNKTPALTPFKAVCNEIENDEKGAHDDAMLRYTEKKEAAAVALQQWQNQVKAAVKEGETPPPIPSEAREPDKPIPPRIMIADASTEKIGDLLAGNHRGLVLVRSELSGWLGQFDRYGGKGADRAFYLEAWDGGSHVIDRVKFGATPLHVPYASLAIVGNLQPDHLRDVFSGIDDGLAARLFYIWPEPIPPQPLKQSSDHDRARQLREAFARLRGLKWGRDGQGNSVPVVLRLETAALDVLQAVRNEVFEANQVDGAGVMAGWRGKNPGRLLRLALVFEMLEWSLAEDRDHPGLVSLDMVERAADYLDYADAMMKRAVAGLALTDAQRDAAQLARHIVRVGPKAFLSHLDEKARQAISTDEDAAQKAVLNERKIYRAEGFRALRHEGRRQRAFAELVSAGWMRPASPSNSIRPRGDWSLNPAIWRT